MTEELFEVKVPKVMHEDIPIKYEGKETFVRLRRLSYTEMCNLQDEITEIGGKTAGRTSTMSVKGFIGRQRLQVVKKCFAKVPESPITWDIIEKDTDFAFWLYEKADALNSLNPKKKSNLSESSETPEEETSQQTQEKS